MFRSVTSRLTFTCIFLFGTLFVCQLVMLYGFMRFDMKQHENRMLFEVFYRIQDLVTEEGIKALEPLINRENQREDEHDQGPGPMMMFIRLMDTQGQIILQTQHNNHWSEIPLPENLAQYTIDKAPQLGKLESHNLMGTVRYCIGRINDDYILQVG